MATSVAPAESEVSRPCGFDREAFGGEFVERILNHTSGTFGGVTGVYNRFQYLPEMREALERRECQASKLISAKQ